MGSSKSCLIPSNTRYIISYSLFTVKGYKGLFLLLVTRWRNVQYIACLQMSAASAEANRMVGHNPDENRKGSGKGYRALTAILQSMVQFDKPDWISQFLGLSILVLSQT